MGASDAKWVEAWRRIRADGAIQFDFPGPNPPPKPAVTPDWLRALFRFLDGLGMVGNLLFYGTIAAAALTAGWLVWRHRDRLAALVGRRRPSSVDEPDEDWTPSANQARAWLAEAERLAAAGDYAGAARLLLRHSIDDIGRRLPQFLRPSLTARDIATAPALPAAARPAFGSIARVVEVSAFGAQGVTAAAWDECREAYRRFALPAHWRVAEATGG